MRLAMVSGRDLKILKGTSGCDATLRLPEDERRQERESQEEPPERRSTRSSVVVVFTTA